MDIFDSQWLLNMLAKSSRSPQGRILSLFDILDDRLNAHNIHVEIPQNVNSNPKLVDFLTRQAKACDAANPEILAEQIVLIARKAAQQQINHPGNCKFGPCKNSSECANIGPLSK